ncbi:MAG: hypothetical protein ACREAB_18750 [Blastocatellia bacterium]
MSLRKVAWLGLDLDRARNERTIDREGRITTDDSRLHAWVIPECVGGYDRRGIDQGLVIPLGQKSAGVSNRACSVRY